MAYPPPSYNVSDKRQRTVTYAAAKRPIDKVMTVVNQGSVGTTDVTTTIFTCSYPCTMTGLRWNLAVDQSAGTGLAQFVWSIIYLREGETIDSMVFGDGLTFYKPESSVLVWGYGSIYNLTQTKSLEGTTKTMRKMQVGDTIQFIYKGVATNTSSVFGAVQLFIKG